MEGHQKAGYKVISLQQVIEEKPLIHGPPLKSSYSGFDTGKRQKTKYIYIDSKYDLLVLYAHAMTWKEEAY